MLNKLAIQATDYLLLQKAIDEFEKETIIYGIEITLSTFGYFISIIIISFFLGNPIFSLLFMAFFMTERLFIGGYHSSTYFHCFLITNMLFFAVSLITLLTPAWLRAYLSVAAIVGACPYIFFKAPVTSERNPLSKRRLEKNKRYGRRVITVQACMILSGVVFFPSLSLLFYFAALSYFAAFILLITAQNFRGR